MSYYQAYPPSYSQISGHMTSSYSIPYYPQSSYQSPPPSYQYPTYTQPAPITNNYPTAQSALTQPPGYATQYRPPIPNLQPQQIPGPGSFGQPLYVPPGTPQEVRYENIRGVITPVIHYTFSFPPGARTGWNPQFGWDTGSAPPRQS